MIVTLVTSFSMKDEKRTTLVDGVFSDFDRAVEHFTLAYGAKTLIEHAPNDGKRCVMLYNLNDVWTIAEVVVRSE